MFGLSKVEKIKQKHPVLEFIQGHGVALKKNGSGWVGCCPFHEDTSPSLRVSPEKGLWNCFGCNKGGDVITFYQHLKGLDNKAAIEELFQLENSQAVAISRTSASGSPKASSGSSAPPAQERALAPALSRERAREEDKAAAASPVPSSASAAETASPVHSSSLLRDVVRLYHEAFLRSPEAQRYLEGRGLKTKELWRRFQIGYCDGSSLKTAVKEGSREAALLKDLGLLNERGNESFYKCLIFPLLDESGAVVSLYGRSIEGKRHLYLKGKHRGLFNAPAAKASDRLILTESVIDAMSLIELGVINVLPLYGVQGLTEDHAALIKSNAFKEVVLCLDNDAAGLQAIARLSPQLLSLSACLSVLSLPEACKDLNEYIQQGGTREGFEALLAGRHKLSAPEDDEIQARALTPPLSRERAREEDKAAAVQKDGLLDHDNESARFLFGDLLYQAQGFKTGSPDSMRVILRASRESFRHVDRVDLYSDRSRRIFAASAATKLLTQDGKVEEDLLRILGLLEDLRRKAQSTSATASRPTISATDKAEALSFLKSPRLLRRIARDIEELGYVGQDREKLLLYLSATGRITENPVHVSLESTSASGKSQLMETVVSLFPPEEVQLFSRISAQSLYYMDSLKHRLLIVDERSGAEEAELSLRSLMSRGKLDLAVVKKDEKGNCRTQYIEVEGPATVWDSTTGTISEDNRSRVFEIWMDESPEQTRRIHERQRLTFSREGAKLTKRQEDLRRIHRNAQRLLKAYPVSIPFKDEIAFPGYQMRARRDHPRFLQLIANTALLHQHQRPLKRDELGEYIEATADDYAAAYEVAAEVMAESYAELSREDRRMVELVEAQVDRLSKESGLAWHEHAFSRREAREWSSWTEAKTRRSLYRLERLEFVRPDRRSRGRDGWRYRLATRSQDLRPAFSLMHPDELRRRMGQESGKTNPNAGQIQPEAPVQSLSLTAVNSSL